MVQQDALNGTYASNPFEFQHFNCNFLAIRLNGEQIPLKGYIPDFTGRHIMREYRALFDNLGMNSPADNVSCDITVDYYLKGYTLFAFDLTHEKCNG